MCQKLTGKLFFAVERDPGKLTAVVIQETGRQTDTALCGDICQGRIMVSAVKVVDFSGRDQALLYAAQSGRRSSADH